MVVVALVAEVPVGVVDPVEEAPEEVVVPAVVNVYR